jgi:hypothetical protein
MPQIAISQPGKGTVVNWWWFGKVLHSELSTPAVLQGAEDGAKSGSKQ